MSREFNERQKRRDEVLSLVKAHGTSHIGLDLMAVWEAIHTRPVRSARILFPGRRPGYVTDAHGVKNFCCNLATANSCHDRGDYDAEWIYLMICKGIWDDLSGPAKPMCHIQATRYDRLKKEMIK